MGGELSGKTAIITGAGRGYGMHFAQAIAGADANVVLASRGVAECEAVAEALEAAGAHTLAVAADVADEQQVQTMIDAARGRFGEIDILINNAGHPGALDDFEDLSADDWETPFRVNVLGSIYCSKAVLPSMIARGGGHIVHISSLTARHGHTFFRSMPYTVSKFSLEGLSWTMSVRLEKHRIRVNTFLPGLSHTKFFAGIQQDWLKGIRCQYVAHVEEPMIHLLAGDVASGDVFNAVDWLENQGKLDALSYVHDGGVTPEEDA